ncbi:hypothetical protein [Paractinoplanes lichenicola]|uniref:Uncharacterized protein n=1 Tax=Paractinoplanes lichenicola TaxID=2802976 RepID=A0ABS1VLR7_9ACTN|nr:hypothetical protein [Actinoplanes lichenicola]MBL7255590.1 hypothetical protein [Actinoplanes lichenicola]
MGLRHLADLSAARWLVDETDRPWTERVTFGPGGFAAYARVRFLDDPAFPGQSENDVAPAEDAPTESEQIGFALETLSGHTATPDDCYFCLWDGWGTEIAGSPRVELPHRSYFLFRGSLTDWRAADLWPGQPRGTTPDPAFVWPADHAWCLAKDVDPHWAGVGGSEAAVAGLLADPRLDVVRADPAAKQPTYY